jgi:phosphomethylpyrimidine synthase
MRSVCSMNSPQDARDFAAKQNTGGFLAASSSSPLAGEGDSPELSRVRGPLGEAEAEAGLGEMVEKFRETGGEIYLPAAE